MTKNPKIILNRVQKGKKISLEEEKVLLNELNNGPFTLQYASSYREKRWIEFEEALEDYCDQFGLYSTDRYYLLVYIKLKIKGPWIKIEKYLTDDLKMMYRQFMIELGFEEHAI